MKRQELNEEILMKTTTIVYWQEEDGIWLGHLQNHPDYLTQGETLAELKENLTDLSQEIAAGWIPKVKTVEKLVIP
jgi:predicted RNase H-like HicB family nuclease